MAAIPQKWDYHWRREVYANKRHTLWWKALRAVCRRGLNRQRREAARRDIAATLREITDDVGEPVLWPIGGE